MSTRSSEPDVAQQFDHAPNAPRPRRLGLAALEAQPLHAPARHLEHRRAIGADRRRCRRGAAAGRAAPSRGRRSCRPPRPPPSRARSRGGRRPPAATCGPRARSTPGADLRELGLVLVELVAERAHDLLERVLAEREARSPCRARPPPRRSARAARCSSSRKSESDIVSVTKVASRASSRRSGVSPLEHAPRARRARARSRRSCRARTRRAGSACGSLVAHHAHALVEAATRARGSRRRRAAR